MATTTALTLTEATALQLAVLAYLDGLPHTDPSMRLADSTLRDLRAALGKLARAVTVLAASPRAPTPRITAKAKARVSPAVSRAAGRQTAAR